MADAGSRLGVGLVGLAPTLLATILLLLPTLLISEGAAAAPAADSGRKVGHPRAAAAGAAAAAAAADASPAGRGQRAAAGAAPPTAYNTHCGNVRGVWEDGAAYFKGIPYAQPPVGEQRWRISSLLEKGKGCWEGTYDASQFGSECTQSSGGATVGSEDCLFINVITYNLNNRVSGQERKGDARREEEDGSEKKPRDRLAPLLPVAVWIHGGFEMFGSGDAPAGYSPTPVFANNTGVVAVSFNYRLNVLGFLALNILDEGSGAGNYGFLDQVLALHWIQRNIEAFGGDPNQVTILGQSAGGTSVTALLSSPVTRGLFHSAVLMSGSTTINATIAEADKDNQVFLTRSGCTTAACLRKVSADDLLSMMPWSVYPFWGGGDAFDLPTYGVIVGKILVIDGLLLTAPSLETIASGSANDVPVVIGSAGQEADIGPPVDVRDFTWDQYDAYVKKHMDTFVQDPVNKGIDVNAAISQLYPHNLSSPDTGSTCVTGTPEYLLTSVISDVRVTCPTALLARYYAMFFKSPVYNYVITQCPSVGAQEGGARYAYHTWGIDALFNFTFSPDPRWQPNSQDWALVSTMQDWFRNFVRGQPPHPQWQTAASGTFSLKYEPEMLPAQYHSEQCSFFDTHGFIPYRWQN